MNYKVGDVVVLFLGGDSPDHISRGWDGFKARIVGCVEHPYGPLLEPLEPRPDTDSYIEPYSKFAWAWQKLVLDEPRKLSARQRVAVRELEAENARLRKQLEG